MLAASNSLFRKNLLKTILTKNIGVKSSLCKTTLYFGGFSTLSKTVVSLCRFSSRLPAIVKCASSLMSFYRCTLIFLFFFFTSMVNDVIFCATYIFILFICESFCYLFEYTKHLQVYKHTFTNSKMYNTTFLCLLIFLIHHKK